MALAWITQDDFAAGVLRSVGRDMDVGLGVSNSINGFFDDDGDVYLRGKTVRHTDPPVTRPPLTFLWTGLLGEGPVGLASDATNLYRIVGKSMTSFAFPGIAVPRPVKAAVVGDKLFLPNGTMWDGTGVPPIDNQLPSPLPGMTGSIHLCACGERLVIGQGRFIRFSEAGNPLNFSVDDYHELPEGAQIRGLASIKDTLIVFTGYGIWAIENLALDLTDDFGNPQQVVQKLVAEAGLLHEAGLTEWGGRIVAPCTDRVILVDTISSPTTISDSIAPLYREHIRAGRLPGGAKVFQNHLFLPWLDPDGDPVSTMVCRLNRPIRARMTYYPWTILDGHAAKMTMADISAITDTHTMLAAHMDGEIMDYGNLFSPDVEVPFDADNTPPTLDLETRDFPTGNGQPNHFRALRTAYTLRDLPPGVGWGDAHLDAAFSSGQTKQTYEQLRVGAALESPPDPFTYADVLTSYLDYAAVARGRAGADLWPPAPWAEDRATFWSPLEKRGLRSDGVDPAQWILEQPKRIRYVRVRLRCIEPVAKLTIHRVGFGIRPATHQR